MKDIETRTVKITINKFDLYFKVGYESQRPIYMDITLGQSACASRTHEQNAIANDLQNRLMANTRAQLEVISRQATALFVSGAWGIDDMITAWQATIFEPSGLCPQLPAVSNQDGKEIPGSMSIVSSPLDAFAKYAARAKNNWESIGQA